MLTTWTLLRILCFFLYCFWTGQHKEVLYFPGLKGNHLPAGGQGWVLTILSRGEAVRAMGILTLPQHPSSQSKAGMVDPERERTHLYRVHLPLPASEWAQGGLWKWVTGTDGGLSPASTWEDKSTKHLVLNLEPLWFLHARPQKTPAMYTFQALSWTLYVTCPLHTKGQSSMPNLSKS